MGIDDERITGYNQKQQTQLLSAFAANCRRNQDGKTSKDILTGRTVKATVSHVRAAFRVAMKHDPALDPDGKPSLFLTRQISGYIDADPSSRQQKALPVSLFKRLLGNTFTPADEALGQLACGAFFFRDEKLRIPLSSRYTQDKKTTSSRRKIFQEQYRNSKINVTHWSNFLTRYLSHSCFKRISKEYKGYSATIW